MLKTRKKILIVVLFFVSIVIAAWFIFFQYGSRWLEREITLATEELKHKGYAVSYSAIKASGNPLSVQVTLQNPQIKDPHGLFDWKGQEIKIIMRPWEYYSLHCSFPGDQKFIVSHYASLHIGTLNLEGASAIVALNAKGKLQNFSFTVSHLSSILLGQLQPLTFKDLSVNIGNITDPLNLKISLNAQLINIEKLLKKEPSNHPFKMSFIGDLSGFKSQRPFPKSLTEWRDGGGVLEVRRLSINWSPILAEIEGTLTLDEDMYPLGSFSSQIYGYGRAINDMVELEWIKKKKATVALFMLELFSSLDGNGEKRIKAPITLQNKRLSVGPAPLLKLKPIGGM